MVYAPIITSLYAGLLAFMLMGLSAYVIKGRFSNKVGLGDGGNDDMLKRIRIQGNFLEYVPVILIMMVIMEINGMHPWILHTFGITLMICRALHAYGVYKTTNASLPRFIGAVGTFLLIIIAAIACITRYIL